MKQKTQNKIEWKEVELKEVCEITSSKRIYQNEYVSEGVPFYRIKEVIELSKGKTISIELFISRKRYEDLKESFGIPKRGDILITAVGTIGISYVIPNNEEFYFKDGNLLWLRKLSDINPIYLSQFLSNHFNKNKNDLSSGSAYNALTIVKLNKLKIPIPFSNNKPDLKEQERIVKILEKAEKIKERGKNAENLLDEYLKSVFYEMFYNKGFEEVELGNKEFFDVQSGGTPLRVKKEYWGGEIPWIGSTACKDLSLYKSEQFITKKGLENSSAKLFSKDTILIALVGATIGKTALLKFDCATNQNIAGIIIKDNKRVNSNYLFFSAKQLYPKFMSLSGDTFKMATLSFIRSIKIPLPPIHLQQKFAKIAEQVEKMKENIKKTKQNSEELFNSLMQKAFRGEIL